MSPWSVGRSFRRGSWPSFFAVNWRLLVCERSRQIHVALYGAEPHARVEFCPRALAPGDGRTLIKCCLLERGIERAGSTTIVPWGATLEEVRDSLEKQGGTGAIENNLKTRKSIEALVAKANVTDGPWVDESIAQQEEETAEPAAEEKPKKPAKKAAKKTAEAKSDEPKEPKKKSAKSKSSE